MDASDEGVSNCLAHVFAKLDTPDKQRKALNALFERLSHSQIRKSIAWLNSTDFTCDIVGDLPLEVNVMIFQHVPIYQVFQARRVSRTWMRTLSSPDILNPLLLQWDSMGETRLRIPEGLSPQSVISLQAEHIDAYRTGFAFSKMAYPWLVEPTSDPAGIAYADGILAWIDKTGLELSVLYIELATEYCFLPRNREHMVNIALSTKFVAATTLSGKCYVWELPDGETCSFRLTSVYGNSLVCSGTTIAILHHSKNIAGDYMTTWNLETQKSYYFPAIARENLVQDVDKRRQRDRKRIIVSNSGQSVIIFERATGDPEIIYFKRLSLDGHVQALGSLDIRINVNYVVSPEDGQLLSSEKCPTIWSYSPHYWLRTSRNEPSNSGNDGMPDLHRVMYDSKQECLRVDHHSLRIYQSTFCDENACQDILHNHDMSYIKDFFFWKDVAYYHADWSEAGLKVIDLKHDTCRVASMDQYTSDDFERFSYCGETTNSNGPPIRKPLLFGDGTYLVNVFAGGFVAWCFDKNITMANEDKGYRAFRENAIKKKLGMRTEAH